MKEENITINLFVELFVLGLSTHWITNVYTNISLIIAFFHLFRNFVLAARAMGMMRPTEALGRRGTVLSILIEIS